MLFEAYLFKHAYTSLGAVVSEKITAEEMSNKLVSILESSGVAGVAPSIGIPILMPDGVQILRGPSINVPELVGHRVAVPLGDAEQLEKWVRKGWIDLRAKNISVWRSRFEKMLQARAILRDMGSASASIRTFMGDYFEIGEVVAWIFNNELGGYRVK